MSPLQAPNCPLERHIVFVQRHLRSRRITSQPIAGFHSDAGTDSASLEWTLRRRPLVGPVVKGQRAAGPLPTGVEPGEGEGEGSDAQHGSTRVGRETWAMGHELGAVASAGRGLIDSIGEIPKICSAALIYFSFEERKMDDVLWKWPPVLSDFS